MCCCDGSRSERVTPGPSSVRAACCRQLRDVDRAPRARKGMRPEAGARYADRVRGRALHHLRKHCIGRTRSPYARAWRADGRLAVLLRFYWNS